MFDLVILHGSTWSNGRAVSNGGCSTGGRSPIGALLSLLLLGALGRRRRAS